MIGVFFVYSVKVAVCMSLFYLFQKLLMSRDTFHVVNRFAILSMMLWAMAVPFIHVSLGHDAQVNRGMVMLEGVVTQMSEADGGVGQGITFIQLLFLMYICGVALFLVKSILSVASLLRLLRKGHLATVENGVRVYVMKNDISPFSWFHYIVMSEHDWQENRREIVLHEMAHIRKRHSVDVAFCNLVIIFQWFSPAVWLLKRELLTVHEYEADEAVLRSGVDATNYQLLLIRKAVGDRLFSMANNLNHNSLKKRITMMKLKKSNPAQKMKFIFVLPLTAIAVAAFASSRVENIAERVEDEARTLVSMREKPVETHVAGKSMDINAVADTVACGKKKDKLFVEAETMPEFPGGQTAFIEYLSKNVKYPESEINSGVDARVVVSFYVNKDGSISDAKVMKSQGEAFDSEALRIVNGMPKWTPGTLNGKPVKVKYTLPVRFSTKGIDKVVKSVKTIDLGTQKLPDETGKQVKSTRIIELGDNGVMPKGKVVSTKREHFSSNDFVVVVDGKVIENLDALKPADIQSVDVRKDEETMKKYNAVGKQGVMIVKTK